MSKKQIFITATDTDCGKTRIACGILDGLVKQGKSAAAFKPIAAGCTWQDGTLKNQDAVLLGHSANAGQSYQQINPIAFKEAIAPHIAAQKAKVELNLTALENAYQNIQPIDAEYLIIEGAGGWQLPLNCHQFMSDWVSMNNFPVILVVGMRLGCLNHALLSVAAILSRGCQIKGWVANTLDPESMPFYQDNYNYLKHYLFSVHNIPCLGQVPYMTNRQSAADFIDLSEL